MWNSVFMNSGTRGNKFRVMGSLSVPPPSTLSCKTRGSPGRVKQGGSKNPSAWIIGIRQARVKKAVMKEKSGKILGLLSGGKKESIFWQKVLQKCTGAKRQKKRRFGKIFKKDECQIFLSKEIVLGHPCIPRVRVDTGSDKAGYEKEGRSWRRGGGGERGRGHIRGTKG